MGLSRLSINTRLIAAFSIVIAILVALVSVAAISQNKQVEAQRNNVHTYAVIEQIDGLSDALMNMETGARGFLLAGVDTFLEPFNQGRKDFDAHLAQAEELTQDEHVRAEARASCARPSRSG